MNPWPAPSVPTPTKIRLRRRRQAGGGDTGTVVPKGGAAKDEPCNGASRGPGHTGDGQQSTAKRARRRSGPARTSAIGGEPRRRCKLEHGDHARYQRAGEHHSGGGRPPAGRQKTPTHIPAALRPSTPRPGIATRMGRNPPRPARGSVARGAGPSGRARSEGGGVHLEKRLSQFPGVATGCMAQHASGMQD